MAKTLVERIKVWLLLTYSFIFLESCEEVGKICSICVEQPLIQMKSVHLFTLEPHTTHSSSFLLSMFKAHLLKVMSKTSCSECFYDGIDYNRVTEPLQHTVLSQNLSIFSLVQTDPVKHFITYNCCRIVFLLSLRNAHG